MKEVNAASFNGITNGDATSIAARFPPGRKVVSGAETK